jgi:hypothetical protein
MGKKDHVPLVHPPGSPKRDIGAIIRFWSFGLLYLLGPSLVAAQVPFLPPSGRVEGKSKNGCHPPQPVGSEIPK